MRQPQGGPLTDRPALSVSDSRPLELFRETFSRAIDVERIELERLAAWAQGLADEGVAELEFVRLLDQRPHVLVKPIGERALVSIYNDETNPRVYMSLYRTVFERVAPRSIEAIEMAAGQNIGKGNEFRELTSRFLDALAAAFREAAGKPSVWALRPGEIIKRVTLHELFGGSPRGGIAPSRTSPNVFLFTDPAVGHQHGYYDGWVGERFHYTGMGQRGDQELRVGNRAVLEHERDGRVLRLFRGAGGNVTYVGSFRVDPALQYYRTDAPETGDGPIRQVLVFRLIATGDVDFDPSDELHIPGIDSPSSVDAAVLGQPEPTTEFIAVEEQHTEQVIVRPAAEAHEADRREQRLVLEYQAYMEARGSSVVRFRRQPPGEAKPIVCDLYDSTRRNLIEAKGVGTREAIRMAIGQLADYRRFAPAGTQCAVLLPSRPRRDLEELLDSQGVQAVWRAEDGFADNASGQFTD
jgi:hypothetical protein